MRQEGEAGEDVNRLLSLLPCLPIKFAPLPIDRFQLGYFSHTRSHPMIVSIPGYKATTLLALELVAGVLTVNFVPGITFCVELFAVPAHRCWVTSTLPVVSSPKPICEDEQGDHNQSRADPNACLGSGTQTLAAAVAAM